LGGAESGVWISVKAIFTRLLGILQLLDSKLSLGFDLAKKTEDVIGDLLLKPASGN
jgi:hypothetical protein